MRIATLGATAVFVSGRFYKGECLDFSRNFFKELDEPNFDPKKYEGTWFEINKDKFNWNELTGKCNRMIAIHTPDGAKEAEI